MPTAPERLYCPIKGFIVWTPDNDSMLAYDWSPLPKLPTRAQLRHRLCMQRSAAAKQELAYLRERCAALGAVIAADEALADFRREFDGLEKRVLKEMNL